MGARDTNDPDEILKNPADQILRRLHEDANQLAALSAIDQQVLKGLVDPAKQVKSEQEEELADTLRCIDAIVKNAHQARHNLEQALKEPGR